METRILNGILCIHDIPVESWESNDGVLFLHNEREPLANIIGKFSQGKKVNLSYFVSDTRQTEEEAIEDMLRKLYGVASASIESSGHPYSEVTPDICWHHENTFKVGGHDMNMELSAHEGKWLLIRVTLGA